MFSWINLLDKDSTPKVAGLMFIVEYNRPETRRKVWPLYTSRGTFRASLTCFGYFPMRPSPGFHPKLPRPESISWGFLLASWHSTARTRTPLSCGNKSRLKEIVAGHNVWVSGFFLTRDKGDFPPALPVSTTSCSRICSDGDTFRGQDLRVLRQ